MNSRNEKTLSLPRGWGEDDLSSLLEIAFKNTLATFVRKPAYFSRLSTVHDVFRRACEGLDNPPNFLAALFLLRAVGAFDASVRLAAGGHIPESYPLLRSMIEYSLYAHHLFRDDARSVIWISRHNDIESMKRCRKEFSHANVIATLAHHLPKVHPVVARLYEQTIDFGAHPNERGVSTSTELVEEPGRSMFRVAQLQGDGPAMNFCLSAAAQAGIATLSVFEPIFEQRFRLLAVDIELENLRREILT